MYITIVGTNNFLGSEVFKVNQTLFLVKDLDNLFDQEAIKVVNDMNVPYGYVANSVNTVAQGTYSSGRIYDKIADHNPIKVVFILRGAMIAEVLPTKKSK